MENSTRTIAAANTGLAHADGSIDHNTGGPLYVTLTREEYDLLARAASTYVAAVEDDVISLSLDAAERTPLDDVVGVLDKHGDGIG